MVSLDDCPAASGGGALIVEARPRHDPVPLRPHEGDGHTPIGDRSELGANVRSSRDVGDEAEVREVPDKVVTEVADDRCRRGWELAQRELVQQVERPIPDRALLHEPFVVLAPRPRHSAGCVDEHDGGDQVRGVVGEACADGTTKGMADDVDR